jgi:hypothetical protein
MLVRLLAWAEDVAIVLVSWGPVGRRPQLGDLHLERSAPMSFWLSSGRGHTRLRRARDDGAGAGDGTTRTRRREASESLQSDRPAARQE